MKYKNISKRILEVPGVGVIKPDEVVEIPKGFNNANFEEVKKVEPPKVNAPVKEGVDISNNK